MVWRSSKSATTKRTSSGDTHGQGSAHSGSAPFPFSAQARRESPAARTPKRGWLPVTALLRLFAPRASPAARTLAWAVSGQPEAPGSYLNRGPHLRRWHGGHASPPELGWLVCRYSVSTLPAGAESDSVVVVPTLTCRHGVEPCGCDR